MDRAKLIKSNASIVETTDRAILEAAHKDMIIRRGCKFGIAYITENLKGKVYYALDEITSLSVTDKTNFTNDFINAPKLPICTTELRYLFRNWQRYIGKVSFMKIKEIKTVISVYAPWDQPEYIAGWASYALDRIAKTAFEEGPVTLSGNTYKQKLADLTNKIQQKNQH